MAILGIDEVGRGPLAGPLVVGAVILPEVHPEWASELKDSKKLSAKKREVLNEVILAEALATGIGWVSPLEIDELGIGEALRLATRRAVKEVRGRGVPFSQIIIDGKVNFLSETSVGKFVSTAVKADDLIKEVSAASIIAKVARDHYMYEVGKNFPGYGFEKHVGYGTAKHIAAIRELGVCPEHRRSFEPIRSMVGFDVNGDGVVDVVKNTTMTGNKAEEKVAEYLVGLGHEIVARNFKTKTCEIDIVSEFDGTLYFTEVKYRKSDYAGGGLAAITAGKTKRMKFAVGVFLKCHPEFQNRDLLMAVASVSGDGFSVEDWFSI